MIALVRGVIRSAIELASIWKVRESTSANTGVALACSTAKVVADMVSGGTMTSSPGPTPIASSAACMVAVPLTKEMAYVVPKRLQKASSKRFIITEPLELRNSVARTSWTYFSSLPKTRRLMGVVISGPLLAI